VKSAAIKIYVQVALFCPALKKKKLLMNMDAKILNKILAN
jgi:hypothetical protein